MVNLIQLFFWLYYQLGFLIDPSGDYQQKSSEVLKKFNVCRRRDLLLPLKLASNTYNDNAFFEKLQYTGGKENATLMMLVRNWELEGALKSMRALEDRFNHRYQYDWVFLNDVPFTDDFIIATSAMASGMTFYGLIPPEDWNRPDWINETLFQERLETMQSTGVIYGGNRMYRNMCRFNSGFFYKQKLLENYDYYLRVEPNVDYYCDFPYDPFKVMRTNQYKYGFILSLYEYENTIPSLWENVEEYIETRENILNMKTNSYNFLIDQEYFSPNTVGIYDSSSDYNLCHFWSNFEVGDLNFFRSKEYNDFFDFLDSKGGFYYERWGDAPVHTIAASLLLRSDEIIHFDEIAYEHKPYFACPKSFGIRLQQRCICDVNSKKNIDPSVLSCLPRWWRHGGGKKFIKPQEHL
ncbi:putative mannosyltransferase KTR2 [Nakaseomyces bracarensis]|uniref:Mannosyltransferase KTR2 n=1 Tax=Nakaseomyces bracarensis TaxID=273131 RepID=A0ABR4NM83_9SACH